VHRLVPLLVQRDVSGVGKIQAAAVPLGVSARLEQAQEAAGKVRRAWQSRVRSRRCAERAVGWASPLRAGRQPAQAAAAPRGRPAGCSPTVAGLPLAIAAVCQHFGGRHLVQRVAAQRGSLRVAGVTLSTDQRCMTASWAAGRVHCLPRRPRWERAAGSAATQVHARTQLRHLWRSEGCPGHPPTSSTPVITTRAGPASS
jgi:hypothetical protein